ncbi:MAG: hypothetical protein HRF49_00510 [bacterium]|jgi:hypothetical protein
MNERKRIRKPAGLVHIVAWVVFGAWAGFWMFFNVASGFGEIAEYGTGSLIGHLMMPAGIVIVLAVLLLNRLLGGLLLLAGAVGCLLFFRGNYEIFLALTLVLPQLLAGALFIAGVFTGPKAAKPANPAAV